MEVQINTIQGTGTRPKNFTVPLRAGIGRERSPSVKRGLNDGINSQNKRRNVGKPLVQELKRKLEKLNPLRLTFSVMVFLKVPLNRILWMT